MHNTASWVAAAAPTDASRAGSWVCHACTSRASAAAARPARKSSVPSRPAAPRARRGGRHPGGKALRLGHLTGGDQDLQRVQQAAIGCRRVAAGGRGLRQPVRRLRRPAQVPGFPASRLQLAGQPVVRAHRRRHPVRQRLVPIHQARRPLVQPSPPDGAEIVVDGPVHQQMGKTDPGRHPARLLGKHPRRHRLLQRRERIIQARQRGRHRQLAVVAEHRRRRDQLPGSRAQRAHPRQHHPGQRPRHPQRPAGPVKALAPQLFQYRPDVQRVAAGVLEQAADGAARQLPGPQRPAQRHHIPRPQPAQRNPAGPMVSGHEAGPALPQPGQLPRASRHHHQHLIGLQTAHGEQQRPRRRPIRPLQIIDDHQHHPPAAADLTQPHDQLGAHRQRVHRAAQIRGQQPRRAAPRPPGASHQLAHDAVRQQQLRLIATSAQHHRAGQPRGEPRQQARLADADVTLDQHHLWVAAARRRRSRRQHGQLIRPADKHPPTRRWPAPDRLVHPQLDRILPADRPSVPSRAGLTAPGAPTLGDVGVPRLLGLREQPPPTVFAGRRHPHSGPALARGVKAYPHYLH